MENSPTSNLQCDTAQGNAVSTSDVTNPPVTYRFIWDNAPHINLFKTLLNSRSEEQKQHPILVYSCFNYNAEPLLKEDDKVDTNGNPTTGPLRIYYAGERFLDDASSHVTVGFLPNNAYLIPSPTNAGETSEMLRFVAHLTDDQVKQFTGLSKEEATVPFPIMIINIDGQQYPHQQVGVGGYYPDNTGKLVIQLREQERNQLEWWLRSGHLRPDVLTDRYYLSQHACIYRDLNIRWRAEGQRIRKLGLSVAKPRFCCFVVSNPGCQQRNKFFELVQAKLCAGIKTGTGIPVSEAEDQKSSGRRVDSLGKYKRNVGPDIIIPDRMDQDSYFDLIRQYRFMITFENHALAHYQTEKIFNAYMAGTVSIYWGDPFIDRVYDTRTFVSVPPSDNLGQQFRAYRSAIEQLQELESDPVRYVTMFDHNPVPEAAREDKRVHDNLFLLSNIGRIAGQVGAAKSQSVSSSVSGNIIGTE